MDCNGSDRSTMNSGKRLAVTLVHSVQFSSGFIALLPRTKRSSGQSRRPSVLSAEDVCACTKAGRCKRRPKLRPREKSSPRRNSRPRDGTTATVPTTVVAALVKDKTLPDPLFGMNLRDFPGHELSHRRQFFQHPDGARQPLCRLVVVSQAICGARVLQGQDGLAEIRRHQLSRQHLAQRKADRQVRRRRRRLAHLRIQRDRAAKPGAENVLAVQVFAPTDHDLAITFVDWNPAPPDKNMGLWREVYLTTSGPVALRYPTVVSKLNPPANDSAQLTVTAQVKNGTNKPVKGKLKGQIENRHSSNRTWNSRPTRRRT